MFKIDIKPSKPKLLAFPFLLSAGNSSDIPYLERVLVDQVQGVAGELGTTTGVTANQIRVLVTCSNSKITMSVECHPFLNCLLPKGEIQIHGKSGAYG